MPEKTFDELFAELVNFIHWLAIKQQNSQTVMMDKDELIGELYVEFVVGVQRYGNKPKNECMAILRRMFDNRIAELKAKYHYTHRAAELDLNTIPLQQLDRDAPDNIDEIVTNVNVEYYQSVTEDHASLEEIVEVESTIRAMYLRLSENASRVFQVLMGDSDNPMILSHLLLSSMRANAVYDNGGTIRLRTWQIADALFMLPSDVQEAMEEIKQVYNEVTNDQV